VSLRGLLEGYVDEFLVLFPSDNTDNVLILPVEFIEFFLYLRVAFKEVLEVGLALL
jgi:hypothetical protein